MADAASTPAEKADLLQVERRSLSLGRSYEAKIRARKAPPEGWGEGRVRVITAPQSSSARCTAGASFNPF
jgi:hypothetical protein